MSSIFFIMTKKYKSLNETLVRWLLLKTIIILLKFKIPFFKKLFIFKIQNFANLMWMLLMELSILSSFSILKCPSFLNICGVDFGESINDLQS